MCLKLAQMFVEEAARWNKMSNDKSQDHHMRTHHHTVAIDSLKNALACGDLPPDYVRDVNNILHMLEGKPRV